MNVRSLSHSVLPTRGRLAKDRITADEIRLVAAEVESGSQQPPDGCACFRRMYDSRRTTKDRYVTRKVLHRTVVEAQPCPSAETLSDRRSVEKRQGSSD
ncbi:hypothetical protein OPT61_g6003 [Boeremia exigua]|uniref:Uncharacterized protein n=1 Tax=Boeremia exigua TaxID=749465 RepID=A0ACC2I8B2_9PLEO|nr:hypothetical protein OPT61_g6003 [Boeremia exigua]